MSKMMIYIQGSKNLHNYLENLFQREFQQYFEDADLWIREDDIIYVVDEDELIEQIKQKYISIDNINGHEDYYTNLE